MSVLVTNTLRIQPIQTDDKRLPIAIYFGIGNTIGDGATGQIQITFSNAKSGMLFNVEQLYASVTGQTANEVVNIEINSQMLYTASLQMFFDLNETLLAFNQSGYYSGKIIEPWRQIFYNDGTSGFSIQFAVANVLNKEFYASAWGYLWDAGAFRLKGGPIKPGQYLPA